METWITWGPVAQAGLTFSLLLGTSRISRGTFSCLFSVPFSLIHKPWVQQAEPLAQTQMEDVLVSGKAQGKPELCIICLHCVPGTPCNGNSSHAAGSQMEGVESQTPDLSSFPLDWGLPGPGKVPLGQKAWMD